MLCDYMRDLMYEETCIGMVLHELWDSLRETTAQPSGPCSTQA